MEISSGDNSFVVEGSGQQWFDYYYLIPVARLETFWFSSGGSDWYMNGMD